MIALHGMRAALSLVVFATLALSACHRCEDVHTPLHSTWNTWLPYATGDSVVFTNGIQFDTLRVLSISNGLDSQPFDDCAATTDIVTVKLLFGNHLFDTIVAHVEGYVFKVNALDGFAVVNVEQPRLVHHENLYANLYSSETLYGVTHSNVIYLGRYPDNNRSFRYAQHQGIVAFVDPQGYFWVKQ